MGDLVQPHITFTIAMAHSYCIDTYIAPEELNHGADAFLEVLCQTMEVLEVLCQQICSVTKYVAQAKNLVDSCP